MQTHDLELLFDRLLLYRDRTSDLSTLGPWLQHQLQTCVLPDLEHIPYQACTYTRNCIAREQPHTLQGFEAYIMRWDQQVSTPIHGHPMFSFYHVITGVFAMERFTYDHQGDLQHYDTALFHPADTTWFLGQPGRYDNYIHRVTCLEPGHTLHIYSEDARQGISLAPCHYPVRRAGWQNASRIA